MPKTKPRGRRKVKIDKKWFDDFDDEFSYCDSVERPAYKSFIKKALSSAVATERGRTKKELEIALGIYEQRMSECKNKLETEYCAGRRDAISDFLNDFVYSPKPPTD